MTKRFSDQELRQQVRSLLAEDKDLRGYGLQADVIEGEVQLQGIVDTLGEKERAAELIARVPGVSAVTNAVTISTDGGITSGDVDFEVQEELAITPGVDPSHIGAESAGHHGTVVLKGQTDDPAELKAAREAAAKARGVTKVVSQVKTAPEPPSLEDIFHSQVNNDRED